MADGERLEVQQWITKRRVALVLSVLRGETAVAESPHNHGLTASESGQWLDRFLLGAENGLRARPKDEAALREEESKHPQRELGELTIDLDA